MRSNVVISKSYTKPILDWLLDGDNLEKYLSLSPYHASGKVIARPNIDLRDQELVDGNFPFKDFSHLRDLILQQYDLPNRNREGPDTSKHDNTNMPYFVTDKLHCRFNILIQSPEGGGNPIIDGVEIDIEENEPWMVQAGLYYHGSSVVEGDKIRILCSFGHYIPIELADERGWASM